MSQERKQYDDDDGHVIVNMDVEGMPWHGQRARREASSAQVSQGDQLSQAETRQAIWGAVLAGLAVVGVFALVLVLFTLFCIYVWFR